MPNWKKVITSGSDARLNTLNVSTALTSSGDFKLDGAFYDNNNTPGTSGQILFSTATGLEWGDNVAEQAQDLVISGKNMEATTIQKGTPLYFSGSNTSGNIVGVYFADAGNPDRMPAGGIAAEQLTAGQEGNIYIYGFINGVDTSAFAAGDNVFVGVGGGYTNIKPTGSALIQKLGNVEKSAINGSGVIQGPSWYNDLPNWEEGKIMVGRSDGQPVTSSFVHLDEDNGRVGIGTTSPSHKLHVQGTGGTLLVTRDINTAARIGIGTNNPSLALFLGTYSDNLIGGVKGIRFYDGNDRLTALGDGRVHFNASRGYYFYPTGSNPSYDNFGVEFRHLRDSATFTTDNILLVEQSDGSDVFNIKSSGNVGIGTTSPGQKLHVEGTIRIGSDVDLSRYASTLYTNSKLTLGAQNLEGANISISTTNTANAIGIRRPSSGTISALKVRNYTTSDKYVDIDTDGNAFFAGSGSFSNGLTVTGSLTVSGSSTFTNIGPAVLSGSVTLAQQADNQGLTIYGHDDRSQDYLSLYLDNFGQGRLNTGQFSISTAAATWTSTSYIRINAAGANYVSLATGTDKVTVGSTSGTAKLQVRGLGTSSSTTAFKVENANASSSLEINDFGNVAIGGTPSASTNKNLLITGPTGAGITIESNNPRIDLNDFGAGSDNNPSRIASYNGNLSLSADVDSTGTLPQISLSVRGSEIGTFTETGLGIFNNTPAYALDVSGSGNFTDGLTVTGSILHDGDLTVSGKVTAQEFHTEFVSASIIYQSGSTKFGDTLDDIHSFTGSLQVSGSTGKVIIGTEAASALYAYRPGNRSVITVDADVGKTAAINFEQGGTIQYRVGMPIQDISGLGSRFAIAYQSNPTFVINGNAGIGINKVNPSYDLDVSGSGNYTNGLTVTGSLTVSGSSTFTNYGPAHLLEGNVGIGTTTPSQLLDVTGNIKGQKLLLNTTNTGYTLYSNGESRINGVTFQSLNNTDYLSKASGAGDFYVRNTVSGERIYVGASNSSGQFTNYLMFDGANDDFRVRTADSDRLLINSSGNVGIGTTVPETALDITGDLTIGRRIFTRADGNRNTYIETGTDLFRFYVAGEILEMSLANGVIFNEGGLNAVDFRVESDTNPHMFFIDSGENKIGIGTSTPTYTLDVAGTGNFTGGLTVTGSLTFDGDIQVNDTITTPNNVSLRLEPSGSTGWVFFGSPTDGTKLYHYSRTDSGQSTVFDFDQGYYSLSTAASNGFRFVGDNLVTGDLTVNGIVTAQEFHTQFVSASIVYQSGSTKFGDTSDDIHSFTGSLNVQSSGSAGVNKIALNTSAGLTVASLSNNNSDTFPVGSLNISYGSNLGGQIVGNSNTLKIRGGYNTSGRILFTNGLGGGDQLAEISSNGLDVVGNISGSDVYINNWGSVSASLAAIDSSGYVDGSGTSNYLPKWSDTDTLTNSLLYDNGSGVGIGTTSPSSILHIYRNDSGLGSSLKIEQDGTGDAVIDYIITGANLWRVGIDNSNQDAFTFSRGSFGAGFDVMALKGDGVGIFTTNPGAALDIVGDLRVLSSSISYQENTDVDTGTETVATVAIADYDAAFFDFVIKSSTNLRAGTVFAVHDGTNVEFVETSTQDLGDTTDVTLSVDISGTDLRLRATTTSDNWTIKSLVRTL